jgi:hypothetical protein
MPESTLAKKMKLKPGSRAAILNMPEAYLKDLKPLPDKVTIVDNLGAATKFDWIQVFVKTQAELKAQLPRVEKALKPVSMLWISFPKGASKIQTDLTRDTGWELLKKVDLKFVNLVSVNEIWSAFALRPYKPGEARQDFG